MARLPRLVLPGYPYHVTQRGNRRQRTFFEDSDYALYRDMLGEAADRAGSEVWCYCLMPNHVHVIIVPSDADVLRRTFADAHRRYTGFINARHRWTCHLWQVRFGAVVMDEAHLAHAMRYVSLNPVRVVLVERPEDWAWSSTCAHFAGEDDNLVTVAPAIERYGTSPPSWEIGRTMMPGAHCGDQKLRSDRWAMPNGSPNLRPEPAGRSRHKSVGRNREFWVFSKLTP